MLPYIFTQAVLQTLGDDLSSTMVETTAWECRDQADQAEEYYSHPLRVENRRLQDENMMLKRLLRENGHVWPNAYNLFGDSPASGQASSTARITRSNRSIPYLPVEVLLKILTYAMTSRFPIIDPLCKLRKEYTTTAEKGRGNQVAIHFLTTCKAYNVEGKRAFWGRNSFLFTSAQAVKTFAEVNFVYRAMVHDINFRIIARYYDDEDRDHKLRRSYHPTMNQPVRLRINKRAKEHTLARRGFRCYAWYQLIDFLEALLPPHDPSANPAQPRERLLPNLERLRIDLVNFGDQLQSAPLQLHDVASHQLGCTLNELIITGLPNKDEDYRARIDLAGLLKDDGLLLEHSPTLIAMKHSVKPLYFGAEPRAKIVRAMRPAKGIGHHHHDDHPSYFDDFPPAPPDPGKPPYSPYLSCRTMWKMVPKNIDRLDQRDWVLFDRVSGLPWTMVEDEATVFDEYLNEDDEDTMVCENCGEVHPGAILPDDLMDDIYNDFF